MQCTLSFDILNKDFIKIECVFIFVRIYKIVFLKIMILLVNKLVYLKSALKLHKM